MARIDTSATRPGASEPSSSVNPSMVAALTVTMRMTSVSPTPSAMSSFITWTSEKAPVPPMVVS